MKQSFEIVFAVLLAFHCLDGAFGQSSEMRGAIRVEVEFDGQAPDLPQIVADKNVDFCGTTLPDPVLLVQGRAVRNAVVSIKWPGKSATDGPIEPISLQSRHCLMQPRVQTAQAGVVLKLNSGDEISHNPHGWWNDERTVFNITLLDPSLSFRRKLKWPGQYRIDCDTHSWMKAYIWLFDHPFHAVTSEDGTCVIKEIPAGKHLIHVWHEVLGEKSFEVVVDAGKESVKKVSFQLADHRRPEVKPKTVAPWPPQEQPRPQG